VDGVLAALSQYSWALWLSVPACLTVASALAAWWRDRPGRGLSPGQAIKAHQAYLDALERAMADPAEDVRRRS
jgi:hypothetical protein